MLEGKIDGGLVLQRQIYIPKDEPKVVRIDSGIIARSVGAGAGGFSRSASNSEINYLESKFLRSKKSSPQYICFNKS